MLHSSRITSETAFADYAEGFNGPQSDESLVRRKEQLLPRRNPLATASFPSCGQKINP
jgi:hypothetical protein